MTSAAAPAPAKDWYASLRRLSSDEFRDLKQIAIPAVAKQQDADNLLRFLQNVRVIVTASRAKLGDLRGCPPWLIALHYSLRIAVNLADPGQDYPNLREMLLTKSEIVHFGCPPHYLRDFTEITASKPLPPLPPAAPPAAPPKTPKVKPVSDHPAGSKAQKPAQPGSSASTKSTKSGGGPRHGTVPREVPQVVIVTQAPAGGSKRKAPDTPAEDEEPKGKKGKPAKAPASEGISNIYQFLYEHNERARSAHDSDIEVIETKDAPKAPVAGPSRKAVPAPKAVKAGAKAPLPVSASVAVKDVSEAMLIQSILRSEDIIPVTTKISPPLNSSCSGHPDFLAYSGIAHSQTLNARSHPRRNRLPEEVGFLQPNKGVLHQFLSMLPATVREDLPFDEETNRYIISDDWIRQMLNLSRPQVGPRCTNCLSFGSSCVIEGTPAMCRGCRQKKTTNSCSLLMSGEVLGALGPEVLRYADMSNAGWKEKMENAMALGRVAADANTAAIRANSEYQYGLLQLLLVILKTRRSLTYEEFLDRFAGEDEAECDFLMEVTLKLAMAQSLTAESDLHRGWVWHAVSYDDLRSPLPAPFKSAWDFYKAVDNRELNDHYGFFLIPALADKEGKAQWVEVKANDCLEVLLDDKKLPAGVSDVKLRNRLAREFQRFEGLTVPEKTADGRPHPFKVLRDTPGFLGKLKKLGKVTDIPDVAEPKPAPAKKKARKGKKAPTSKPNVESDGEYEPPVEAPAPKTPTAASEAEEEDEDSEESTDPEDRFPPAPAMSAKRAGKQRAATPVDSAGEEEADADAAGEVDDDMAPSTWGMPPPPFDGAAS
ncbi:hypothetical protein R3P38DRAFT_3181170 [Favolaschia claudopus]|uniref:Uncharacterized protein n=1 Tax=Favolaschia claudopus TaxID=2862362 RepID=A0AAW0CI14_9AGAR